MASRSDDTVHIPHHSEPSPTEVVGARRPESPPLTPSEDLTQPHYQPLPTEPATPWFSNQWLRLGIFALIGLGIYFFTTLDDADRGADGQIATAGDLNVMDLQVGDCFDDPEDNPETIFSLDAVPCDLPHDNEIIASISVATTFGPDYPGVTALEDHAFERCIGSTFIEYVGIDYFDSVLDIIAITPTQESWSQGDRELLCAAYRVDFGKLNQSVKGSGL